MAFSRRHFLAASAASAAASFYASLGVRAYAAPAKGDWVELFDGKTLRGWHKNPTRIGHGTGGVWEVEDGAIAGEQDPPGGGNGGILLTDQKFGDFELLIDLKPSWGICSGLFLRSNDKGQCLQMMVDYHDAGNVGHLYGEGVGGFNTRAFDINGKYDGKKHIGCTTDKQRSASEAGLVSSCSPDEWLKAWKIDDWNTAHVLVEGGKYPKVSTWINDQSVCVWDGATSNAKGYDKEKVLAQLGAEGSIAVQVHGGGNWPAGAKCRWKNIKIRPVG